MTIQQTRILPCRNNPAAQHIRDDALYLIRYLMQKD